MQNIGQYHPLTLCVVIPMKRYRVLNNQITEISVLSRFSQHKIQLQLECQVGKSL